MRLRQLRSSEERERSLHARQLSSLRARPVREVLKWPKAGMLLCISAADPAELALPAV